MEAEKLREFKFTDKEFNFIRELVREYTGICLADIKKDMVYSRLSKRIRELRLSNFKDYCELVVAEESDELRNFVNAITTNLTSFFREAHHFEFLANTALPVVMTKRSERRRLRIWSAGCSTGEEPYSIAMTIREAIPHVDDWDIKILATDLDTNVLNTAKQGLYNLDRIKGLSEQRLKRWFKKGKGENAGNVKVIEDLKEMITFRSLNLMTDWPMRGPFDIIFCRNVVIYFDKPTQRRLFQRYAEMLDKEGYLFIGHSESLFKVSDDFELIGHTTYTKRNPLK